MWKKIAKKLCICIWGIKDVLFCAWIVYVLVYFKIYSENV